MSETVTIQLDQAVYERLLKRGMTTGAHLGTRRAGSSR
jgi:hypothetical protein